MAERELEEGLLKALPTPLPLLRLLPSHLLMSLHWVVRPKGSQLISQGLQDGESVALVADQGLVQPGQRGESGG